MNTSIPKDPTILLSYVNTQLRDFYHDLDDLCNSLDIDKKELEENLAAVDYHYDRDNNKFI